MAYLGRTCNCSVSSQDYSVGDLCGEELLPISLSRFLCLTWWERNLTAVNAEVAAWLTFAVLEKEKKFCVLISTGCSLTFNLCHIRQLKTLPKTLVVSFSEETFGWILYLVGASLFLQQQPVVVFAKATHSHNPAVCFQPGILYFGGLSIWEVFTLSSSSAENLL